MITFLYCIDSNYNSQAVTSINSLILNSSQQFKVIIIHKNPESFLHFKNKLISEENLVDLKVIKFINPGYELPGLEGAHVSEATYYRLFLTQILDFSIEKLIYLDADVVCVNNPFPLLDKEYSNFEESGFQIGVKTTNVYENDPKITMFSRLNIFSKYFNAGVMFINYNKWIAENLSIKLLDTLEAITDKIEYWDQDVLNTYFDGNYFEINETFNYLLDINSNFSINEIKEIEKKTFFHYVGSLKPWSVSGALKETSKYYHHFYKESGLGTYHIVSKWKSNELKIILNAIKNSELNKLNSPVKFLWECLKSLILRK